MLLLICPAAHFHSCTSSMNWVPIVHLIRQQFIAHFNLVSWAGNGKSFDGWPSLVITKQVLANQRLEITVDWNRPILPVFFTIHLKENRPTTKTINHPKENSYSSMNIEYFFFILMAFNSSPFIPIINIIQSRYQILFTVQFFNLLLLCRILTESDSIVYWTD